MKLTKFVDGWNNGIEVLKEFDPDNLLWLEQQIVRDFVKAYGEYESKSLSVSSLYKPLAFLMFDKLGYPQPPISILGVKYHLIFGMLFETVVVSLLWQYGVDIHSLQKDVKYKGVPGHPDLVYADNTVIDIKTMSAPYFKSFLEQPNDNRGYITQILCYREALGLKYAGILAVDKWFGKLAYIPIENETIIIKDNISCEAYRCLERADQVIHSLAGDFTLEDAIEQTNSIQPYHHSISRKLIVPESIRYDSRQHWIFAVTKGGYVKTRYSPEIIKEKIYKK